MRGRALGGPVGRAFAARIHVFGTQTGTPTFLNVKIPSGMKITRRLAALLFALAIPFVFHSSGQTPEKPAAGTQYIAYVGTYTTKTRSKGIYAFRFDATTGQLNPLGVMAETPEPSFLAVHPSGKYLYAVNEVNNFNGEHSGAVSAYTIDRKSGKLTLLNQVATRGAGQCHVSLDRTGKFVFIANYDGGSIASFPVLPNGHLGAASGFVQHTGSGPNTERQKGPHAHWIGSSPDNHFVLSADLGLDEVLVYRFDAVKGSLTANNQPIVKVDPGAGPRHMAFTPSGDLAYVVNELKSTISGFTYRSADGVLTPVETIPILPPGYMGQHDSSEIMVHPSGRFLYVSNRGDNSIVLFWIFSAKGMLTRLGRFSTQGQTPRSFAIDPTGKFLLAANQGSNDIVVFHIDPGTGSLHPAGQAVRTPAPVCITFIPAE